MLIRITPSIVPNLLTLGNLFSGFASIVSISNSDYKSATLYIFAALLFDTFDGIAARLIGATSELGAQLDSLCDVVSFGIAPSYLLYQYHLYQYGNLGLLLASLPALFGAIRLARFNAMLDSFEDKIYFTGFPIPSSAITIFSYIYFLSLKNLIPAELDKALLIAIPVAVSLAMVSNVKCSNIPRPSICDIKARPILAFLFVIAITSSIITEGKAIFFVMALYLILSSIKHLILYIKTFSVEDEIDEQWNDTQ
ncbi:MAG: CDP-diacylglycerol--serine O-phosphatidyltransferase [Bacteroidetes bacterium 4572_77]|nr:MAG: CDP-diacylglycerol--serine O-phosphatidyltransferase [Bacteroidetes bacterium 4572_77]